MDVLKSKTVTGGAGLSTVSSGGLGLTQILSVHRQGIQYSYVTPILLETTSRAWTMFGHVKRIIFQADTPFASGGETIFIIYKVTT